jgi:hypothetical protein
LRSDLACAVRRVTRAAFDRGFDAPLERFREAWAHRALASARAPHVDLPDRLSGVQDWDRVDSTPVTVRHALREAFPGTGDDAAIKVHQVLAVGGGAPVHDHVSPARAPDSRPLQSDESWRGYRVLADLADASLARLRAGEGHGVCGVIRLNDHWTPTVDHMARGHVPPAFVPGTALDVLLADDTRVRDGRAIDADGHVGGAQHPRHLRLLGVQTPQGSGVFRTNLAPRLGPRQVADLDRGRWEVERSLRLDTSGHRLDTLDAERPCSLQTRVPAARIASTIAARLAPTPTLKTRPLHASAPRMAAPLHPRRLAWPLAVAGQSIAHAFDRHGVAAKRRWEKMAERLTPAGRDPNGRRRPAVLAQFRGWKRRSVAQDKNRNHRQQMAA